MGNTRNRHTFEDDVSLDGAIAKGRPRHSLVEFSPAQHLKAHHSISGFWCGHSYDRRTRTSGQLMRKLDAFLAEGIFSVIQKILFLTSDTQTYYHEVHGVSIYVHSFRIFI